MQDLPDFTPAFSHYLKPLTRDRSQFTSMHFHPRIDGGIALHSTVESQQFRSHRRPIVAFGSMLRGSLHEEPEEWVLRNARSLSGLPGRWGGLGRGSLLGCSFDRAV